MDIREIRRHNLQLLIAEAGGQRALATRSGVSSAYLSQVLSERVNRNVGHNLARRLESGMGRAYGWMDVCPLPADGVREAAFPVYGTASPQRRALMAALQHDGGSVALSLRAQVYLPYLLMVLGQPPAAPLPSGLLNRCRNEG